MPPTAEGRPPPAPGEQAGRGEGGVDDGEGQSTMKKTALLTGAGVLSALLVAPAPVQAAPQQGYPGNCWDTDNVLCLFEGGSWTYRSVSNSNGSWNFGPGNNWNSRADVFRNSRLTQDVCVYSGVNGSGVARRIPLGSDRSYTDFGSSNKWVAPGAAC